MDGFDAVIPGTGTVPISPTVRAGILALTERDFGDGKPVPAACLVIDHPQATSRMEWLRVGSLVHAGDARWRVRAINGQSRAGGEVALTFLGAGGPEESVSSV